MSNEGNTWKTFLASITLKKSAFVVIFLEFELNLRWLITLVSLFIVSNSNTVCGDRLWTFERVIGATLQGFDDTEQTSVQSRSDCQRLCLEQTNFVCRYFCCIKLLFTPIYWLLIDRPSMMRRPRYVEWVERIAGLSSCHFAETAEVGII